MKKIYVLLLMALPALMLQSCLKDQEDVFDKSASARMTEYLKNANDVLVGAANGWVLDYYPDRDQSYGGTSITLKFDSEKVDVISQRGIANTFTSLYKMVADDGPVLTFDTYNFAIHFFATPWGSSDGYEAYDGDFEFIIMEATPQKVTLKGKRSGNIMYMYPLQRSAEEYITDVAILARDLPIVGAKGNIGTVPVTMDITLDYDYKDYHVYIETPDSSFEVPYVFYDKGIRFYQPIELGGKSVYQMEYNNDAITLNCTDEGSTDVVLEGILSPVTIVKQTGRTLAFDDNAGSESFDVNKLEQFSFTPNDEWIHVSTNGNTLTISVDENATGEMRTGSLTISVGELSQTINVSQAEFEKDILGDYTIGWINNDKVQMTGAAKLYQDGDNLYMQADIDGLNIVAPLLYNEQTMTFRWESCIVCGMYKSYYIAPIFLDADENYWTSYNTGNFARLTIAHDENGTHGLWHGIFDDDPNVPVTIWLYAFKSAEISSSSAAGWLEKMHNVTMQKITNK
jgi:hypothetical protein